MKHPEYELQVRVCSYLRVMHPNCIFYSDTVASVKLTILQGARNKKVQCYKHSMPDLFIFGRGSIDGNEYIGLCLELKVESPFKKDGTLKSSEHLQAQAKTLEALRQKGYFAGFAWEYESIISIINQYLSK